MNQIVECRANLVENDFFLTMESLKNIKIPFNDGQRTEISP